MGGQQLEWICRRSSVAGQCGLVDHHLDLVVTDVERSKRSTPNCSGARLGVGVLDLEGERGETIWYLQAQTPESV